MIKIAPSILSADFSRLGEEINRAEVGGADLLHIDVMDGHFVPNITIGVPVVRSIRPVTDLPFDCHLMISNPVEHVDAFIAAGADIVTVHAEASDFKRALDLVKAQGVKGGVAIKPSTPLSSVSVVLESVDLLLIMTVNPGFSGQSFMSSVLPKVREAYELRSTADLDFDIGVDGGIKAGNAEMVAEMGADMLVSGSGVFSDDPVEGIRSIREAAEKGMKGRKR